MACQMERKYAEMTTVMMEGSWKNRFRKIVLAVNFLLSLQYVFITVNKLHLSIYYLFNFKNRVVFLAHSVQCCVAFVALLSVGSRYSWLMHEITTKVYRLREMLIHKLAPDINMNKLINYSVEQSPFWEACSFLGCQAMSGIYATRRINTVHKSSLLSLLRARWISASF